MFVGFLPQRPVNLGIDTSEFLFQVLQEPVHGQVHVLVSLIVVVHAALPALAFLFPLCIIPLLPPLHPPAFFLPGASQAGVAGCHIYLLLALFWCPL